MKSARFLIPLSLSLLVACGPNANSPEGIAGRYVEAQMHGNTEDMAKLVTSADAAAINVAPNNTNEGIHPDEGTLALVKLMEKRLKVTKREATVSGDKAQASVTTQRPNVDLSDIMLGAMFGADYDEETLKKTISERVDKAELTDDVTTLNLVKEGGAWRVDTDWAEKAEAKKKADAEAKRQAELSAMRSDYDSGMREDFARADAALTKLVAAFPNDAGWKREKAKVEGLKRDLGKLTLKVKSAELDQGVYRFKADVKNANTFPLETFTIKLTFLNGSEVVGEPKYDTYRDMSFFGSGNAMSAKSSTSIEGTGEPPSEWEGKDLRAELTAYEVGD